MKKSFTLLLLLSLAISNANAWLIDTTGVNFMTDVFTGLNELVNKKSSEYNWKYITGCKALYYDHGRTRLYVDPGSNYYYAPSNIPMVGGSSYTTSGILWLSVGQKGTQTQNIFMCSNYIYSLEIEYCKFDNLENEYLGLYAKGAQSTTPELISETDGVKFYRQTFYPHYPTQTLDVQMTYSPSEPGATKTKFVTDNSFSSVKGFVANKVTIVGTTDNLQSKIQTALNYYRNSERHDKTLTYYKEKYSDTSGADINEDGAVNGADVVSVYNTIINGAEDPQQIASHAYADLGLPSGTKWATMNLGAEYPEDMGDYYAYNEKDGYSYYTNKAVFTNYNYHENPNNPNLAEGKDIIFTQVGHLWGNGWTMPTLEQWVELFDSKYTTHTYTEITSKNGTTVKGVLVKSNTTGQSIFLPAAGRITDKGMESKNESGHYWTMKSSTVGTTYAYIIEFSKTSLPCSAVGPRRLGNSVRPVHK